MENSGLRERLGADTEHGRQRLSVMVSALRREGKVPKVQATAKGRAWRKHQKTWAKAKRKSRAGDSVLAAVREDAPTQPGQPREPELRLRVHRCPRCRFAWSDGTPNDPLFDALFDRAWETAMSIALRNYQHETHQA